MPGQNFRSNEMALRNQEIDGLQFFEMQKQWSVKILRCISEWANCGRDANEMPWKKQCAIDRMNQWIDQSKNQWRNEPMSQWVNESMTRLSSESKNQSMNEWFDNSVNQWINESMNQWVNAYAWTNKWINEWMTGWMSELLLCRATSSLSDLFAEAPLVSASSSLTPLWCPCNPA